ATTRARAAVANRTRCRRPAAGGGIFSFHVRTSHPLQSAQSRRPYRRTVCHYTPWYRSAIRMHRQDAACVVEFQPMSDVVRLEYRNVTMRFAAAFAKGLTAGFGGGVFLRAGRGVLPLLPPGVGQNTTRHNH